MWIAGPVFRSATVVGSAIGVFPPFRAGYPQGAPYNELLYFACGSKFIKVNAVFANALADKHWNCGIDHGRWATEIGLHLGLTGLQVAVEDLCDQSGLPIPPVLCCSHRESWHETEPGQPLCQLLQTIQVEQILRCSGSIVIGGFALDAAFCHTVKQRPERCHSRATADADDIAVRLLTKHEDAVRPLDLPFLTNTDTALQQTRKSTTREDLDHEFQVVVGEWGIDHRVGSALVAAGNRDISVLTSSEQHPL